MPPMYRECPFWYKRNFAQISASFTSAFRQPIGHTFSLASYTNPTFERDGIHLTEDDGLRYVGSTPYIQVTYCRSQELQGWYFQFSLATFAISSKKCTNSVNPSLSLIWSQAWTCKQATTRASPKPWPTFVRRWRKWPSFKARKKMAV